MEFDCMRCQKRFESDTVPVGYCPTCEDECGTAVYGDEQKGVADRAMIERIAKNCLQPIQRIIVREYLNRKD